MADLEEHTTETVAARCEECGALLTEREVQVALERGGAALCTLHATELLADGDTADEFDEAEATR